MRARQHLFCSVRGIFVAFLILGVSSGMAMAQVSDTGEMDVSIVPADSTPAKPGQTPGEPGTSGQEGYTPGRIGTVSAWLVYDEPASDVPRRDEAPTLLIVRDDRGTTRGWAVTLSASGPDGVEWSPVLLENRTSTIVRILPPTDVVPAGGEDVTGGRTLGPLPLPLLALQAQAGSGSGVYVQDLGVAYPEFTERPGGTMVVDIPCGP